ncbi:MAG: glutamate synthase subunit beta [Clostridium sp.]|jgi:glutamate synthase (NADPH/NADH) small chain|uniref:glutamate synthase subunit beta n=1 Tax=Clostridium sp. TaxID=1506 RepID=UPI0025BEB13F|nr:glutamate synthase subunit beta [Clostridium sp.]MCH3963802.1 glutamate synthase subunit beta [Clostridium sp.]MCI1714943.1 glutamate synthase subunit beta [Clostridium sp.]MCI1798868.1 glutamate synthase subunit beta [Clostridium sp.]MCI1813126.1 glutamate synthase subunit beta [Clostridium sp.]MCI1870016.1 glutamate synthase subunit beta [Clostridium sp.]
MGKLTGFKEFNRKDFATRPVENRIKDYKEVHNALPIKDMEDQAARCMNCGTPFCNWGCPLGNLIPDWNDFAYNTDWKKAYDRLSMTNNFPEFTGRICPALCEASCTLGVNYDPVSIRELEYMIIEKAFKEGWVKPVPPRNRTGRKVAVVGSGPSGLSAAVQLNSVGHEVVVFERHDEIGGLLRYGIPDFKLEKSVVRRRIGIMEEEGVEFRTNVNVGADITAEELLKEFDAVVLAGGSTIPRNLEVPGRELDGIHFAVDYLTLQNKKVSNKNSDHDITARGKSVLVIGGGDTGSDCIGTAIRQGAKKVYQIEIMPKPPVSRDDSMPWPIYPKILKTTTSHEEGCERMWNISTKWFIGKDGNVNKVHCAKVKWHKNNNGNMSFDEISGSEFDIEADLVLIAMGFLHPDHEGLLNALSLNFDVRGNIDTSKTHMTNVKGVFSAGDMRTGQSLVVKAIEDGRITARYVDEYLMGDTFL